MAVELNAHIENNDQGGWQIKLSDPYEDKEEVCVNIEDFADKLEIMGETHGDVEVVWSKADDLRDDFFMEVRYQMSAYEEKLKNEENK